jgi:hypothetical protein
MWLSKQTRPPLVNAGADWGVTSISGKSAGVVTRGEVRQLPVYGPGGYAWQPETGETVMVMQGGTGGEESCVVAAKQGEVSEALLPGEVCIHRGESRVYLKNDGTVEIHGGTIRLVGRVEVEGSLYINGSPYSPCYCM